MLGFREQKETNEISALCSIEKPLTVIKSTRLFGPGSVVVEKKGVFWKTFFLIELFSLWGWLYTCYQPGASRGGVIGHRQGGGRRPPAGGIRSPPVLPTLTLERLVKWNNYQNGQGDCLMGVSQGTVFGRVQPRIWNSEIFYVSDPPPYEKNKLLLNEYLGDFMHFESLFFLVWKWPPLPIKCGKFHTFFETSPKIKKNNKKK